MSTDLVLRTVGTLACIYMVGLFVSAMSVSALNAASNAAGSPCSGSGCHIAYQQNPAQSSMDDPPIIHAAALFVAESL
jgi:hypothetical protein